MPIEDDGEDGENAWKYWRKLVIQELKDLHNDVTTTNRELRAMRDDVIAGLRKEIGEVRMENARAVSDARAAATAEIAKVRSDAEKDASALRATTGEKFATLTAKTSIWAGLSGTIAGALTAVAFYLAKGGH